MQNLRSALQKHLKGRLSTSGIAFIRFLYGAPIAVAYMLGLVLLGNYSVPSVTFWFVVFAIIGGLAQIGATALLVYLFSFRNFAVGVAFSKTETIQTAIFGFIILGETVSPMATIAVLISMVGIVILSVTQPAGGVTAILKQSLEWTTVIGIASGALFALASITYRAAALSLGSGDYIMRAAFTLACVTVFQTAIMALYIQVREPAQTAAVFREWRIAVLVGISGVLGSAGWFTAMTLQNATYVKALGQIELLFTFATTYLWFKEETSQNELVGIFLIASGIFILVLSP